VLGANAALQQTATALPANCILHTLESGDTPFGIAEIYGASGFDVMEINGLNDESATALQIGDVLIVPLEGCSLTRADVAPETTADAESAAESTAEATAETTGEAASARPTLTLPPTAVNAQVEIVSVLNPGDITAEGVEIRNRGGAVDLNGWTLSDGDDNTFTFPAQRVFTNAQITVFTRAGQNTPIALYWGQRAAVFGEPGDIVTLADANGVVQSTYRIAQPVNLP
jgi:murein DD-endopeptidase MepM/ murein hydrolase activator NlpD